jgi:hypothetical protein
VDAILLASRASANRDPRVSDDVGGLNSNFGKASGLAAFAISLGSLEETVPEVEGFGAEVVAETVGTGASAEDLVVERLEGNGKGAGAGAADCVVGAEKDGVGAGTNDRF